MLNKQTCPQPPEYQKQITLRDGRQALFRPILGTDEDAILALFDRQSPETTFLRFHYAKPTIPADELEQFCYVDYCDCFALVAEMPRNRHMEIVGVGRYARLPGTDTAEIAFVVEDKEQGNGIGAYLLKELANIAKERKFAYFVAELLNENVVMLYVLRKYYLDLKQETDGNRLITTIPI